VVIHQTLDTSGLEAVESLRAQFASEFQLYDQEEEIESRIHRAVAIHPSNIWNVDVHVTHLPLFH
jgi:hypothetical protein